MQDAEVTHEHFVLTQGEMLRPGVQAEGLAPPYGCTFCAWHVICESSLYCSKLIGTTYEDAGKWGLTTRGWQRVGRVEKPHKEKPLKHVMH